MSTHFHAIVQLYMTLENTVDIYFNVSAADKLTANIDTRHISQGHTLIQ